MGKKIRKSVVLLLAYVGLLPSVQAQLELVPLGTLPVPTSNAQVPNSARTQVLTLPFFDDFSTASLRPDPSLWEPGSGVYINNTLTTTHPSINIATFDGLNAQGAPYNFGSELAQGDTDTLTSLPINLSGLSAADSVYLSFYWQARGLGELPDGADTFRLEFLNQAGDWITVWRRGGAEFDSLFQQAFVPIREVAYLHANFRFRFRAYGRQSGSFDTWHLDYIYLNKGRSAQDRYIKDVAVRQPLSPLFKRYTAMPLKQYRLRPEAEIADSVRTDINNLFNTFNFTSFSFTIQNAQTGQVLQRYEDPLSVFIGAGQTQPKAARISPLSIPAGTSRLRLKYTFDLLTTDDQNPSLPTVNLRRNDTISAYTELADYYAYDDGSAEYGVRMNQRLGRTFVRFVGNERDTLGGIRIALVPFRTDLTGQNVTLQVYSNANGRPDRVLHQQSVPIRYGTSRNAFIDYPFSQGVAVTDTFYVGWLQIGEGALVVGFDRNSTLGTSQLFTNLSQEWVGNTELQGSVMIRPYVGGRASDIVTGPEPTLPLTVQVYPNPSDGYLRWDNDQIRQIDVHSLQGTLLRTLRPTPGFQEAYLDNLPAGMYLLRLSDGRRTVTHKWVLLK